MAKRRVKSKLASFPSELLANAVIDLTKSEKSADFKVDMDEWMFNSVRQKEPCIVCIAGSVMAHRLGVKGIKDAKVIPQSLHVKGKISHVDLMKLMWLNVQRMRIDVSYDEDPNLFKTELIKLADAYRKSKRDPFFQCSHLNWTVL